MVCWVNRAFGERGNNGRKRVNKSEIADGVTDRTGVARSATGDAVDGVFEAIGKVLARARGVRIARFGTFGIRRRSASMGRNPRTGESLNIAASTASRFGLVKQRLDAVNNGSRS
ncbi:MAG: HU family DNA-binding protein [Chloroflexi bacterium]|nr:HU family DNA-binding protein [Chloroflexota bacterium]